MAKMRLLAPLRRKYLTQKYNAKRRHIAFRLTFEQWLEIWETSGRLSKMGRRSKQYCMARHGDKGAYAVGNVHIITCYQNKMELGIAARQQMSAAAKQRCARIPAQEMKHRMQKMLSARDLDEWRKTSSRQGKRLWASMTAAQRLAKMEKMITARWSR